MFTNRTQAWLKRLDPRSSLQRTLSSWFILFALVPLLLVVTYATYLFNQRINSELEKRLVAFEQGLDLELIDVEEKLRLGGFRHANDYYLMNLLRERRDTRLKNVTQSIIENYIIDRISYFDEDGKHFLSVKPKRIMNDPEIILPVEHKSLDPDLLKQISEQRQVVIKRPHPSIGFALDCYTSMRIGKKRVGVIKETIIIDRHYSLGTKDRTGLDICLLDSKFQLLISTLSPKNEASFSYPNKTFQKITASLKLATDRYMMLTKQMLGDNEAPYGYLAILVSRANAEKTLWGILNIFFLICVGITIIVIVFTRTASKTVLTPIQNLLSATQEMEKGQLEHTLEIPKMDEIGSLVNSFNQMSDSIHKMKSELEQKVKELNSTNLELKQTQAQLVHSSKMVSLGQLVAGVAHELNNPIGYTHSNINHLKEYMANVQSIIKAYERALTKLPKDEKEKIAKLKKDKDITFLLNDINNVIKSSLDGTKRTKDIVQGLRNFSRLDEAEIKVVDLHEGIQSTLSLLHSALKNKIRVHKEFGDIPRISCYSSQLNQVFMNLLTNAIQSIEKKGNIWIQTKLIEDAIHISIKDTGKGISPEHLNQIFDPFFTTKKTGKGTGLGLSISYGIVEKHGGKITVQSDMGKGSTFTIILPKDGISQKT